jgi:hypothetical protein
LKNTKVAQMFRPSFVHGTRDTFILTKSGSGYIWEIFSPTHLVTLTAMYKNLTPWRDSNLEPSVLEADAMTTVPRRQGNLRRNCPRLKNAQMSKHRPIWPGQQPMTSQANYLQQDLSVLGSTKKCSLFAGHELGKPAVTYSIASYYSKAVCLNLFAALPKVYYHRNCTVLKHC